MERLNNFISKSATADKSSFLFLGALIRGSKELKLKP